MGQAARAAGVPRQSRPRSAARAGAGLLVRLDSLAVDLAAPRPGRGAALLDEVLEPLQVALNAHVVGAEHVADALGHVLRLPVEVELDLRLARVERCEEHDALVPRVRGPRAAPGMKCP